jgi:hypothetical protein
VFSQLLLFQCVSAEKSEVRYDGVRRIGIITTASLWCSAEAALYKLIMGDFSTLARKKYHWAKYKFLQHFKAWLTLGW